MSLPALTHTLGGSEAKVPAPCSPCWPASPSPAGRNILNSLKNNKHGLININRPTRCQKGKREDCALLAGASLDQGAAASSLIIWRQPAGSPSPAPGPGQAEARPGPGGTRHWVLSYRLVIDGPLTPVPGPLAGQRSPLCLKPAVVPHGPGDTAYMLQPGHGRTLMQAVSPASWLTWSQTRSSKRILPFSRNAKLLFF